MRLGEALQIGGKPGGARQRVVHLLVGFEPLHLGTFLKAYLKQLFPEDFIRLKTGLYGDLEGNVASAAADPDDGAVVVIEWSDLDPRLGLRSAGGWTSHTLDDLGEQADGRCRRLEASLLALAKAMPVAVVAPTLPFPPVAHHHPAQASPVELRLGARLSSFLEALSAHAGIRLLSAGGLALESPPAARHDARMELQTGFPYALAHADALARTATACLFPAPPKKGLITDLDETLWCGILGDAGPEGVSWSLEHKSQVHALYQQLLASLAESGVLVAVASKNDPGLVAAAFRRADLLVNPAQFFPIEAGWGPKSASVSRILQAWNIAADSVIFVDDSPLELAEVGERHEGMLCLPFTPDRPTEVLALLWRLRELFGKDEIREEDLIRLQSLRAAEQVRRESESQDSGEFLATLEAEVTIDAAAAEHRRAFDLVNKANQFNLNGVRYTESEWRTIAERPGGFLATVSYSDRFGPLGQIAVIGGRAAPDECVVDIWVMSCRAFSRQIEHQVLRQLYDRTGAHAIRFAYRPTDRNGPLRTLLASFVPLDGARDVMVPRAAFDEHCPALFSKVIDRWTISEPD